MGKILFSCMNYISIKALLKEIKKGKKRLRPVGDPYPSFCVGVPVPSSLDREA